MICGFWFPSSGRIGRQILKCWSRLTSQALNQCYSLDWAGYLARMDDSRMANAVFYGELRDGKRKRGAPKMRFKDQLKRQLNLTSIKEQHWESIAKDRISWRAATKQGAVHFEVARRADLDEKRKRRKASATSCPPDGGGGGWFPCTKACRSRIGLFSHQKSCRQRLTSHWSSDSRNQLTTVVYKMR